MPTKAESIRIQYNTKAIWDNCQRECVNSFLFLVNSYLSYIMSANKLEKKKVPLYYLAIFGPF